MRRFDLSRYAPVGLNYRRGLNLYGWAMAGAALAMAVNFWLSLRYALGQCCDRADGQWVPVQQNGMLPFVEVAGSSAAGFQLIAGAMVAAVFLYLYHRQGSRSDYTMRRLPDRWEFHRRCLTLPLAGLVLCILAAVLLRLVLFAVYLNVTPDVCLPLGPQKIWSV